MDLNTIEVCWDILQQYIKSSDRSQAVSHLVGELLDNGLRDEDVEKLSDIDSYFADAVEEHVGDTIYPDEDEWE